MGLPEIKDAFLLGTILAIMIGPIFFMLIETSISNGIKAAAIFNLGVISSDFVFLLLIHFGGEPLLHTIKSSKETYLISGIILSSYGLISVIKGWKFGEQKSLILQKFKKRNLLLKGFFMNIVNVGSLAFWLGSYVIVAPKLALKNLSVLPFFILALTIYYSVDLIKIVAAKQLKKKKMTPKIICRFKQVVGCSIFIFGVIILIKGYWFSQP